MHMSLSSWTQLKRCKSAEEFKSEISDAAYCLSPHTSFRDRPHGAYLGVSRKVFDIEKEINIRNAEQLTTRTSASFITKFRGATVTPVSNIVISKNNSIQVDSFRAQGHLYKDGFKDVKDRIFSRSLFAKDQISNPAILLGISTNNNYFHWLIEAMPRLLLARLEGFLDPETIIIAPKMSEWMKSIFTFFEFDLDRIFENDGQTYKFDNLIVPARGLDNIRNFSRHATLVTDQATKLPPDRTRKLFISRAKAPSRRMINEPEVFAIASKMGYEIINPEDYKFEDQVKIFSSATHVAGCLGAGLTNVVFSRQGSSLIEFSPEGRSGDATLFANMADTWGKGYACVVGPFEGTMDRSIDRRDFSVDLIQAEEALFSVS